MSETSALKISSVTLQEALEIIQLAYTDGAERDAQFLSLMIEGISELGANEWNEVPDPIKLWYNDIAERASKQEDPDAEILIPPIVLVDAVEEPELEEGNEVAEEAVEEGNEAVEEKVKEPKSKEKKAKKSGAKSPSSATRAHNLSKGITGANRVRDLICANFDISLDTVLDILEQEGIQFKRSSAQVVFLSTKSAVESILKNKDVKNKDGEVLVSAR